MMVIDRHEKIDENQVLQLAVYSLSRAQAALLLTVNQSMLEIMDNSKFTFVYLPEERRHLLLELPTPEYYLP